MRNNGYTLPDYDAWLERQAEEYYLEVIDHDEDDSDCQCDRCLSAAKQAYEEDRADAMIEERRLNDFRSYG